MHLTAMTSRRKAVGGGPAPSAEDLKLLGELAAARKIVPVIDRTYTLEQIVDAHRYVDAGHKRGNVIVKVAGP